MTFILAQKRLTVDIHVNKVSQPKRLTISNQDSKVNQKLFTPQKNPRETYNSGDSSDSMPLVSAAALNSQYLKADTEGYKSPSNNQPRDSEFSRQSSEATPIISTKLTNGRFAQS